MCNLDIKHRICFSSQPSQTVDSHTGTHSSTNTHTSTEGRLSSDLPFAEQMIGTLCVDRAGGGGGGGQEHGGGSTFSTAICYCTVVTQVIS